MLAVRRVLETLPQEDLSVLEDGINQGLPPNVLARPTGFKYRLVEMILRLTAHG